MPEEKKQENEEAQGLSETKPAKKRCKKCGSVMKLRHGEFGSYYGCSRFPVCNYTEKVEEQAL